MLQCGMLLTLFSDAAANADPGLSAAFMHLCTVLQYVLLHLCTVLKYVLLQRTHGGFHAQMPCSDRADYVMLCNWAGAQ